MCWIPHEHTFTLVSHSETIFRFSKLLQVEQLWLEYCVLWGVMCEQVCTLPHRRWVRQRSVGDARSVSLDHLVEKCPWLLFSTIVKFDKILSLFSRSFRQVLHKKYISPLAMFLKRVVSVHFRLFGRLLNSFEAVFNTHSFPLMINLFLGTELFKRNMQMSSIWIPFTYSAILNFKIDLHHVLACIIYIKL
jgi:hypothetical protein